MKVLVAQSCPTLCDPRDYIDHQAPLSMEFSVHGHSLLQGIFPTQVSYIAGRFFTIWTTRKALITGIKYLLSKVLNVHYPFLASGIFTFICSLVHGPGSLIRWTTIIPPTVRWNISFVFKLTSFKPSFKERFWIYLFLSAQEYCFNG